ncbi:MAG TPA: glycerate kinase [Clostridia bacterium]|nr:glycerate kinase [Clostridia bacterium]HRX43414.1 glycerate kinase [Clostridia bacterium]
MKILIAPDSYKGCLGSLEVAMAMTKGIKAISADIETVSIPFADGGEGTVEAMLAGAGGRIVKARVTGPLGDKIDSFYGILDDGHTAVIEMAAASGLALVPEDSLNPMLTTTYGTGELIRMAMDAGCTDIIIGVGGSATNDCGTGMAQALGVVFYDEDKNALSGCGRTLNEIHSYDDTGLDPRVRNTNITVACDVDNPLYGEKGAAHVYSPQKGADEIMIKILDEGLENLNSIVNNHCGIDMNSIKGSGAAGGLAGGLVAFTGAKLEKGINIVSDVCRLDDKMKEADLALTGEGRTDYQTAFGKVPAGIAESAARFNVPVICISGSLGKGYEEIFNIGITAAFSISQGPGSLEDSMKNAAEYIERTTRNIVAVYMK